MLHKKTKSNDVVMIKLKREETVHVTCWKSCANMASNLSSKQDNCGLTFSFKDDKKKELCTLDPATNISYSGEDDLSDMSSYFIAVREGDQLVLRPAKIYNMKPKIAFETDTKDQQVVSTMSKREQMDELNDKFGSKRSKKMLADKRKFAVELNEEDLNDLKADQGVSAAASSAASPSSGISTGGLAELIEVIPPRNGAAVSISDVYELDDIFSEQEQDVISANYKLSDSSAQIKSDLVRKFVVRKEATDLTKTSAIYLDLVMQLFQLKFQNLRKEDPLPEVPTAVKDMILDKYCVWMNAVDFGRPRRAIPEQYKDRLLAHGLILLLMLSNYKTLKFIHISQAFKCTKTQLRKVAIAVGGYIEKKKDTTGLNVDCLAMRLPLNQLKDNLKKHR